MPRKAAKKAKGKAQQQEWPIGTKVCKYFDSMGWFQGTVASFDPAAGFYLIEYEDGDQEEFDPSDMQQHVVTHDENENVPNVSESAISESVAATATSTSTEDVANDISATPTGRRKRSAVSSYKEPDDLDLSELEDYSSEEDKLKSRRGRRPSKGGRKAAASPAKKSRASSSSSKKKQQSKDNSSSDEEFMVAVLDEEEEDSDDMNVDDDDDIMSVESSDYEDDKKKKPRRAKGTSKAKNPRPTTRKKKTAKVKDEDTDNVVDDDDGGEGGGKPKKKTMAEQFKPINTPVFWTKSLETIQEEHEYLDPCGMEATDDVIDNLVNEQILKIGALFQRALEAEDTLGHKKNPIRLGTVCSGTDAPALAWTMVQEQMERLHLTTELAVEHKFSCEKEPFKQSYLARNFDSTLYPDVVKMTEETPRDVYGRPTPVPPINVLVAGTSCKNFSLLHSTKRLDIEDKGCSGETFLATVELTLQQCPQFCIFENVEGAPWAKMQEYISGRVKLATIYDDKKKVQKTTARDEKIKELKFQLQKNKDGDQVIVAIEIPMQVGVRCGAVVKGFLKSGTRRLVSAQPPKKMTSFTLDELLKANQSTVDRDQDSLLFETPCTYCTTTFKVDTKQYGLPQTRMRTYMFVWQPKDPENYDDDLEVYWQAVFKHLESPVRHSLEAFILDLDHDNIRVFREALNGPPGRHTKRSVFQEMDFFSSGNANVKHNKIARERLGIEMMARPNVGGGERGKKQIPPHYWLDYVNTMQQRELDMLDILHISAARDAECHDSNFASFFWNISQNCSKEKHRSKVPGIAGCISPGGENFCSNLGRPLLGCEKLLLQGIPYFRLALGSETEVELGDLAGNAMTLTVVCAAQLAAVVAPQLRKELPNASKSDLMKYLEKECGLPRKESILIPEKPPSFESVSDAGEAFGALAKLAPEAVASSVWCTCESSGRNSTSDTFMHCSICRISCCSNCLGSHNGYQMSSHEVEEKRLTYEEHHMGHLQSKLRTIAPASLTFSKKGIDFLASLNNDIHRVAHLWKFVFNLQNIKRHRRKWVIHYNARDNEGVGEIVAEFRISVGELWRESLDESPAIGMAGELISYVPARTPPLVRGNLECCAVVVVNARTPEKCEWKARGKAVPMQMKVVGSDPAPSFRVEMGLTDVAERSLRADGANGPQKEHFKNAKARGEEGRWLYPKNWKEWPNTVTIQSDDPTCINGDYKRAPCRQTANQSAIWIRPGNEGRLAMYLLIKPNVGRTGPDIAVISTSMSHDDVSAIVAKFSKSWQPCHALTEEHYSQRGVKEVWVDAPMIGCSVPESSISVTTAPSLPSFLIVKGLTPTQVNMLFPFETTADSIILNVSSGTESQKITRAFNYLCVSVIMRHASRDERLSVELSPDAEWKVLARKKGDPLFGFCESIVPPRPVESWYYDDERQVWARRSSPEESRQYYISLQHAQKAFEYTLKRSKGVLEIHCFPEVAAHHAAKFLVEGRGDVAKDMVVSYRFSDTALQSDPEYSPFKVFPCTKESPTDVSLKSPYALYDRQQKVVTKMAMIEKGKVEFEELEMSEHEMPGSTGFSLIAKASRHRKICGGVIADAIGAGKTVISIALILQGLEEARAARDYPRRSGATAVAVPSGLVNQWASEIKKFTSGINVICIHDAKGLKQTSVEQIIEADVVVFPVDIIEPKDYTGNLTLKSGLKQAGEEMPELPKAMGHSEKPGAKGVWIPATSRDPYGIGSANEMKNQKNRDVSAFFTYSYLKAIELLRQKEFKKSDKGVPLEYFEWERVVVDEVHECLCTDKDNLQLDYFKEKNRRASRELLGITQKDVKQRPLVFRKSIFGLTGTPLLDNSNRVIELANLIGCTYIIGLASHWRKLERESRRDIFLQHYLEPKQSREVRKAIYAKCQSYLDVASCRNTTEKELEGISLQEVTVPARMTKDEVDDYIASQHGIDRSERGLAIRPENFDPNSGHDISKFLRQNADSISRGKALVDTCQQILSKDPTTKIIVFTDGRIGAGNSARKYLEASGLGCTWLDVNDSVEEQNRKISFYQRADSTVEDHERPRVLVLHFDHAAGLNLQKECYNLIMYSPLYVGDGGITGDPVADASTEQQAIGRVFRPGQLRPDVFVYRIELQGPQGEECLDGYLIRRNTDPDTLAATTNAGEA